MNTRSHQLLSPGAALSAASRPSVCPSVLCLRFSGNRKTLETSNYLVET